MVSLKSIEDIINKCSNQEIRNKLASLSVDEKKERLVGKLNPFEEDDYDECLMMLDFLGHNNDPTDYIKSEIKRYEDQLFEYDKRIFRGYDLDKNRDNIPSYNIDGFAQENVSDTDSVYEYHSTSLTFGSHYVDIYPVQYNQMIAQRDSMTIDKDGVSALTSYFGNDYKYINAELDKKYSQNAWNKLSESEKEEHHRSNLQKINTLDKVIESSEGLIVPTILFHGTKDTNLVDIHTRLGDKVDFKGFLSTSFIEHVGETYSNDGEGFVVKFLAPKGTKGVCANDLNHSLTEFPNEHEYLLGKGTNGTVVDIDYDNRVFTVLLE